MERMVIKAEPRELTGKGHNKRLRRDGMVPGIVYGMHKEAVPIKLVSTELTQALNTPAGNNILLDLELQAKNEKKLKETVMIKELTRGIINKGLFTHVDLIRVSLKDKIEVAIPLNIVGEPAGVKEGGVPQIQMREITILSLPTEIPEGLTVDTVALKMGDSLTVGDLVVPPGIEVLNEPEEVIMSILAPKLVEEEAAPGEEPGEEAAPAPGGEEPESEE